MFRLLVFGLRVIFRLLILRFVFGFFVLRLGMVRGLRSGIRRMRISRRRISVISHRSITVWFGLVTRRIIFRFLFFVFMLLFFLFFVVVVFGHGGGFVPLGVVVIGVFMVIAFGVSEPLGRNSL